MTPDFAALAYLVAAVCFILALKGLSSPASSRRGNAIGIAGMTIAVATTVTNINAIAAPITFSNNRYPPSFTSATASRLCSTP